MRRLFSSFAGGLPGIGLLLLRLLTGTDVAVHSTTVLRGGPSLGHGLFAGVFAALALLLVAGLWTPLAAMVVAVGSLWAAFGHPADLCYFLIVGVPSLALALLGPGAWSVDAHLFGWKRL